MATGGLARREWRDAPMTRGTVVFLATGLAAFYVACVLPDGPSDGERVTFTLDFPQPYRVPLAGSVAPAIRIIADGRVLQAPNYRLESLDADVARVSETGRALEGVARGPASVRVVFPTATGSPDTVFTVRVVASRIAVDSPVLVFGRLQARIQLKAVALDAGGETIPGVVLTWSSAAPAVATVDSVGVVTAVNEGTTAITAEADSVTGASEVRVTQVAAAVRIAPDLDTLRTIGRSAQFVAVAFDSSGGLLRSALPRWSSSDTGVTAVNAAGLATATSAGTARIIARVGVAADTATLVVAQVIDSIAVKPDYDTLTAIADTARHVALAFDSLRFPIPNPTVVWATGDSSVAVVDATGLVRAAKSGVALLTASASSRTAFATIVVDQRVVAAQVSPATVTLTSVGDTLRLSAVGVDRNSYAVPGASFIWGSTSECVATVNAGLVSARGGGTAQVIVAPLSGGRSDTAAVSVSAASPGQPEIAYIVPDTLGFSTPIWGLCADSSAGSAQIAPEGWWPAWSPDGTHLAFDIEDFWTCGDIYTARADGSDQRQLTSNTREGGYCRFYFSAPAWSPDGSAIAFSVVDNDWPVTLPGYSYIGVVNADGSNFHSLGFGGGYDDRPTWSPDGTRLALSGGFVLNADGTGIVQLQNTCPGIPCNVVSPAWSPDGSQIAFELGFPEGSSIRREIWLFNLDGSSAEELTAGSMPAWSPDGSRLVFSRSDGLYVISRDGTGLHQVVSIPGATEPTWRVVPPISSAVIRAVQTGTH